MTWYSLTKNAPDYLPDEPPRVMIATQKEMMDNQVPLKFRDYCAHVYIPLKQCRYRTSRVPWACKEEKHAWEHCEVEDYYRRMRDRLREKIKAKAEAEKAKSPESS